MKSKILITVLLLSTLTSMAQRGPEDRKQMMKDRIESMKIAHITKALELTSEEAKKFWPVYNEYQKEMESLREPFHMRDGDPMKELSDSEVSKMLDERFDKEQKMLDTRRKYLKAFKEVLPIRKVAQLYKAEHDFKRKVIDELKMKQRAH